MAERVRERSRLGPRRRLGLRALALAVPVVWGLHRSPGTRGWSWLWIVGAAMVVAARGDHARRADRLVEDMQGAFMRRGGR